jgi:hypothetical protein
VPSLSRAAGAFRGQEAEVSFCIAFAFPKDASYAGWNFRYFLRLSDGASCPGILLSPDSVPRFQPPLSWTSPHRTCSYGARKRNGISDKGGKDGSIVGKR